MLAIKYNGRLGNNLFQYAFGRLCHERHPDVGKMIAQPIPGFPNTCEIIGEGPGKKDIFIREYYQNYVFYENYKDKIMKWYEFDRMEAQPDDRLVIHIRLGDYFTIKDNQAFVPLDVFQKVIDIDNPSSVYIVSEEPNHPVLKRFDAICVGEDVMHDFAFIASAKRLCISNSTFSWWAAWLGIADKIYYPDIGYDTFTNKLFVHNEDRYIMVKT
jgi:hypothetical protein